jgi:hypothetical protein
MSIVNALVLPDQRADYRSVMTTDGHHPPDA